MRAEKLTDRDLYVPLPFWGAVLTLVAPNPKGMEPAFGRALGSFGQYAETIQGDLGESVQNCHKVLERFLETAQEVVEGESGEHKNRLGRPRDLPYGEETLLYQVFQYGDGDVISLKGATVARVLSQYERFLSVLHFMEGKVKEGGLGALQGSFNNMLFQLNQACEGMEKAMARAPLRRTATLGETPDLDFVFVQEKEETDAVPEGTIARIIQQGFAWEDKELSEAVVTTAG